MTSRNVEIVHELIDAFRRRDHEREFELLSPDIVLDTRKFAASDKSAIPGLTDQFFGHQESRDFWRAWLEAWEEIEWQTTETLDAGDRVMIGYYQRNKGRGSGIWIEFGDWWGVFELKDGVVVRLTAYLDREEALLAAGIEPDAH